MKENTTLQNTQISFIPSFLGNGGWETSLAPRFDKKQISKETAWISLQGIKQMLLKMLPLGRSQSWATALVSLFL